MSYQLVCYRETSVLIAGGVISLDRNGQLHGGVYLVS